MPKQTHICPKHNKRMVYSRTAKQWFCQECLYASFLTHQAQIAAQKRYQQSEKFKASQEKYRHSEKGQTAREKYLKGPKYKQRRKEYNERLKESLEIARQAQLERPSALKEVEAIRNESLAPLIQDIREYLDTMGRSPTATEVATWAEDVYKVKLTKERALKLIDLATKRR